MEEGFLLTYRSQDMVLRAIVGKKKISIGNKGGISLLLPISQKKYLTINFFIKKCI